MSFSKPIARVAVTSHATGSDGATRYTLLVTTDRCHWHLLKRFSEIDALRKSLCAKYSSVKSSDRFFPSRINVVLSDEEVARERQELFQTWFAAICSDAHVISDAATRNFLQLNDIWRAIAAGDDRVLELLLAAQVPLERCPDDPDALPLHFICKSGAFKCAEVLLRSLSQKDLHSALSTLDAHGMSPLHVATAQGHCRVASLLLQYGAPPAQNSRSAATPLHIAVRGARAEIIDVLVSSIVSSGDLRLLDSEDRKGRSPLHFAVHLRLRAVVQLLLQSGANIGHCSSGGHTVFHIAAALNDHEILRVLCSHVLHSEVSLHPSLNIDKQSIEASIHSPPAESSKILSLLIHANAAGYTALHVACAANATECIAELLLHNAPVDCLDLFGNTPLHIIIATNDAVHVVIRLLTARANPNATNHDGNSPLHIASMHNRAGCIQQLILHGASSTIQNVYGLSPYDVAVRMSNNVCAEMLQPVVFPSTLKTGDPSSAGNVLLTWGFGSDGRLGHGTEESIWVPTVLQTDVASSFQQVSVGGQMTAAVDHNGKVYTWGCGGSKRLGHGSTHNELYPRLLQSVASVFVKQVTCGHMHAALVTSVGSVFTWGDGDFGKLGHGNIESVYSPTLCRYIRDAVCDVSCGKDHSLALTSSGGILAWGCNKDGRLGLGHTQTLYQPNSIPLDGLSATSVSAGWDHSAAIIDGSVYTWGRGVKGQLGDVERKSKKQPYLVDSLSKQSFSSVKCGSFFTVALSDDGRIFTWGDPFDGKLGHASASTFSHDLKNTNLPNSSQCTSRLSQFDPSSSARIVDSFENSVSANTDVDSRARLADDDFSFPQQLSEFGPTSDKMFAIEIACGITPLFEHDVVMYAAGEQVSQFFVCFDSKIHHFLDIGQLGLGRLHNFSATPAIIKNLSKLGVFQLSAALAHSCCLARPVELSSSNSAVLGSCESHSSIPSSPQRERDFSDACAGTPSLFKSPAKRERADSWKLMQGIAESLNISILDQPFTGLKEGIDEDSILPPKMSKESQISTGRLESDTGASFISEEYPQSMDEVVQDVDLHRLSRMVLQSLQFSDLSNSLTSTDDLTSLNGSVSIQRSPSLLNTGIPCENIADFGPDSFEA